MRILITGGAGFIGSNAVNSAIEKGHHVVVVDNLSRGDKRVVNEKAMFVNCDIRDTKTLDKVFKTFKIDLVMHFAAKIIVSESVKEPAMYYDNNVNGTKALLDTMIANNVKRFVFSSTAAVYGLLDKKGGLILEDDPTNPINPYGETKLAVEKMIQWYSNAYGLDYIIFRYFNVAGAVKQYYDPKLNTAIIPKIKNVLDGIDNRFIVFGNDYNTADGTCIRDYIHMYDLVEAHLLGAEKMLNGSTFNGVYNLGNERGYSVLELVNLSESLTSKSLGHEIGPRREGDPVVSVASSKKARTELGWVAVKDLEAILKDSGING